MASGTYFSPSFTGTNPSNTNTSGGLPDCLSNGNLPNGTRTWNQWFNPAAFAIPQPGHFGNCGGDTLVGPGIYVMHASLSKDFRIFERLKATFTGQVSNVLNHPSLGSGTPPTPNTAINQANPGQFTAEVPYLQSGKAGCPADRLETTPGVVILQLALMIGTAPCGPCHPDVAQSYQQTAHFLTSGSANSATIRGSFAEGRNVLQTVVPEVHFRMEQKGDSFYQTAFDHGRTHSERFDLVLGSGRRGQSYLYWKGGLLYQLPVSYLALTGGWMNSPGYPDGEVHFERVIPPQCLDCHATAGARAGRFAAGITCQKCHGAAAQHPAVRNPASLARDGQVALCAACHSGLGDGAEADVHGNQVGLLRQSKCFRNSPEMSCSTCHNIHRVEQDLVAMSTRCTTCHRGPQAQANGSGGQLHRLPHAIVAIQGDHVPHTRLPARPAVPHSQDCGLRRSGAHAPATGGRETR